MGIMENKMETTIMGYIEYYIQLEGGTLVLPSSTSWEVSVALESGFGTQPVYSLQSS